MLGSDLYVHDRVFSPRDGAVRLDFNNVSTTFSRDKQSCDVLRRFFCDFCADICQISSAQSVLVL